MQIIDIDLDLMNNYMIALNFGLKIDEDQFA